MRRLYFVALAGVTLGVAAIAAPGEPVRVPSSQPGPAMSTNLLARVLPVYDNRPAETCVSFAEAGKSWVFYVAGKEGRYVGVAFVASSRGYNGPIRVLVGVDAGETVHGIEILEQRETRILGARILTEGFRAQFAGKDVVKTRWQTTVRGGEIDAITGATISSDAVAAAVKSGLDVYIRHREAIRGVVQPAGPAGKGDAK